MILEICHSWGRSPGWFYRLSHGDQVSILGWWRARIPKGASVSATASGLDDETASLMPAKERERRPKMSKSAKDYWFGGS